MLEASKQIFVLVAGFKLLYRFQTFCTGLQISGNRFLYQLQTFCTVQFFVLVAGFRCLFVDLKTEQKNKLSFVVCCTLYFVQLTTNILPKRLFWHYNDDDDDDKNQMNLADNLYFILCFNE